MSRPAYTSISAIVATVYCEKQAVFDHLHGRARAQEVEQRAAHGIVQHKAFEKDGKRQMATDRRCFIATALYGADAPQTEWLRAWRDSALMPHRPGRLFVRTYYALSPRLIAPLERCAPLRVIVRAALNTLIRILGGRP